MGKKKALQAAQVRVTAKQRAILQRWERSTASTPYRLVQRCQIVLMSSEGVNNKEQGRRLNVDRQRVRRWRTRWAEHQDRLHKAEKEGAKPKDLAQLIREVLDDAPRPGGPSKFTAEELAQIMAVACESTEDNGVPTSHWTPRELAATVIARGIVDEISSRHVDRLLKKQISDPTKAGTG